MRRTRSRLPAVLLGLAVWLAVVLPAAEPARAMDVSVLSYGAVGDGTTNDRAAIQAAIDAVNASGGGTVTLPGGYTFLTGDITLKSGVTLLIEEDAVLLQSQTISDYAHPQTYGRLIDGSIQFNAWADYNYPLIYAGEGTEDIAITGSGTIQMTNNGSDNISIIIHAIGFYEVSRFTISGITIDNASMYNMAIRQSDNGLITGVTTSNPASLNSDGVSLANSQHIRVTNNQLTTGDDGIYVWASYDDPRGGTWWSTADPEPTYDIEVDNNVVNDTCLYQCHGFVFINWTGGAPDQSAVQISKVNVHDNVFQATRPVGALTNDIYHGGPKTPVTSVTFENNTLIPINGSTAGVHPDFLTTPMTDFSGDGEFAGITGMTELINPDFDGLNTGHASYKGTSFWTVEGDAGASDTPSGQPGGSYGYIESFDQGESSIYQGVYLTPGSYVFDARLQSSGTDIRMFAEKAADGSIVESAFFDHTDWGYAALPFEATEAGVYRLGIDNGGNSAAGEWGRIDNAGLAPDSGSGTIFTEQTPGAYDNDAPYELGTKFYTTVDGTISKVRLYTHASEGGDHTVRIWDAAEETVLAGPYTWTIPAGTEGWKEYELPSPIGISADTDYIVAVSTSADQWYAATVGGFDAPINNGYVRTYAGSGLYSTSFGSMPVFSGSNANYFRDIVFNPGETPPPPPPPEETTILTTQTPAAYANDAPYELGTRFYSVSDGTISKVRIYTNATEGGDHTVRIWDAATGTVLAGPHTWTITAGTEGWKEYELPAPLAIAANTDYIVSVSTSSDQWYAIEAGGFSAPIQNGDLRTYTGSGVFSTTLGAMPASTFDNANYFRDVVFTPGETPPPPPPPPGETTILTTQTPAAYANDAAYELGTKFYSVSDGTISKVRIYTNATEGGDHTVRIWDAATGNVLSGPHTWTITAGTEGWKEFELPTPLAVTANTDYIVSVSTSSDQWFAISLGGYNNPIQNGDLRTYTGSGVFSTTLGAMPASAFSNSNYFRDIVFTADE